MNEKLEEYIKKLENDKIKSYQEYLMKQGVYEKEFVPEDSEKPWGYPYKMQIVDGKTKYYKKIPIELTAEDIDKIDKYIDIEKEESNGENKNICINYERNYIATAIKIIAVLIYIVGLIYGWIAGTEESWGLAIIYWCACAVSGTIMLGFSEIINLLHEINTNSLYAISLKK